MFIYASLLASFLVPVTFCGSFSTVSKNDDAYSKRSGKAHCVENVKIETTKDTCMLEMSVTYARLDERRKLKKIVTEERGDGTHGGMFNGIGLHKA